jgi:hypothetical protein
VIDAAKKSLSENELAVSMAIKYENARPFLVGRLIHASGQWIESDYGLPQTMDDKQMAAAMTYGRRYIFCALVGIAGDEDTDSEPETHNSSYEEKKAPVKPHPKPPQEKLNAGHPQAPKPQAIKSVSVAQGLLDQALSLAKEKQVDNSEISAYIKTTFGVESSKDLSQVQFEKLIAWLAAKEIELADWEKEVLAMDGVVK